MIFEYLSGMARGFRKLSSQFPIHIGARSNNRDSFPLPMEEMWQILTDLLFVANKHFEMGTLSFLLMPNHFHLIGYDPEAKMPEAMEWFMRETSREIGRRSGQINKIWGGPYFSSIIKSPLYFLHAYKYVYRNPVKADLCRSVLDYPYSTLQMLLGSNHGILPNMSDETLFNDLEETLKWLDQPFDHVEDESIKRALRKKEFKLRKHPDSRNPLLLEDWNSVPFSLRNYRK
jgi:putative transposase